MENLNVNTENQPVENTPVETESKNANFDDAKIKEIEEQIKKKYESELDRRITEAIKKREKALKEEFAEKEKMFKMTEEERLKAEEEKRIRLQQEKERELTIRELKLNTIDYLTENGMDLRFKDLLYLEDLVNVPAEDRQAELQKRIKNFNKIFNELVENKVAQVKQELLTGVTPAKTKQETTPVDEYQQALKQGNVKDLLRLKFMKND